MDRAARVRRAHPALVGFAALAAVLSKETGAIAIGLAFAAAWARPPREGGAPLPEALRAAVAPAAAVALAVAARFLVLGELGGHAETGFAFGRALATTKATLLASAEGAPGGAVAIGALAIALGAVALGAGRALVLPLSWLAAALAITAFSGARTPGTPSRSRRRWRCSWESRWARDPAGERAGAPLDVRGDAPARAHRARRPRPRAPRSPRPRERRQRRAGRTLPCAPGGTHARSSGDVQPYFIGANDASGAQELVHAPYSLSALAELVGYEVEVGAASLTSRRTVEEPFATIQLSAPMSRGM